MQQYSKSITKSSEIQKHCKTSAEIYKNIFRITKNIVKICRNQQKSANIFINLHTLP